jgi:hypothetical protein
MNVTNAPGAKPMDMMLGFSSVALFGYWKMEWKTP